MQSRVLRRLPLSRPVPQQRQAAAKIERAQRPESKAISPYRLPSEIEVYAVRLEGSTRAVGYLSCWVDSPIGPHIFWGADWREVAHDADCPPSSPLGERPVGDFDCSLLITLVLPMGAASWFGARFSRSQELDMANPKELQEAADAIREVRRLPAVQRHRELEDLLQRAEEWARREYLKVSEGNDDRSWSSPAWSSLSLQRRNPYPRIWIHAADTHECSRFNRNSRSGQHPSWRADRKANVPGLRRTWHGEDNSRIALPFRGRFHR